MYEMERNVILTVNILISLLYLKQSKELKVH